MSNDNRFTNAFGDMTAQRSFTAFGRRNDGPREKSRYQLEKEHRERAQKQKADAEAAARAKMDFNEFNYPALGGGNAWAAPKSATAPSLSFARLASEWKEQTEEEIEAQKQAEEQASEEIARTKTRVALPMRRFGNVQSRVEDTYEEYEEEEKPAPSDGWETIERKVKPRKGRTYEAPPAAPQEPSVWEEDDYVDPREKETIW
jgi:hypothetical protein